MAIKTGSRLLQSVVVQPIDNITGRPNAPAFVDIRTPVRTYAGDDQILAYDNFGEWPNIGMKFLLNAEAWWAIADLSEIIDPFDELVELRQLRSPTISRFLFDILPGDIVSGG